MAGLCQYADMDRLPLEAFCDMNEMLRIRYENEYRAQKAAELKNGKRH